LVRGLDRTIPETELRVAIDAADTADRSLDFRLAPGQSVVVGDNAHEEAMLNILSQRVEDGWLQSLSVTYEYPVIFTQDMFALRNTRLVDAITRREPRKHHRRLICVGSGILDAGPDLNIRMESCAAAQTRNLEPVFALIAIADGEDCKGETIKRRHQNVDKRAGIGFEPGKEASATDQRDLHGLRDARPPFTPLSCTCVKSGLVGALARWDPRGRSILLTGQRTSLSGSPATRSITAKRWLSASPSTPSEDERVGRVLGRVDFRLCHDKLRRCDETGQPAILKGLAAFREHLGGAGTITLLAGIGQGIEVTR
jgi:hypothetical protein